MGLLPEIKMDWIGLDWTCETPPKFITADKVKVRGDV